MNIVRQQQGETLPVPQHTEAEALVYMIERLARDPSTDLVKLREILDFKREIQSDIRKDAFSRDYVKLQGLLDPVLMRGEIAITGRKNQRYAMFEDIHSSIRGPMTECGFGLTFRYTDPEPGIVAITTILIHREGHREETTIRLPYDTSGNKNNVQSRGSSISYGRRYGVMGVLNLAATGEDDDGVKGGGGPETGPITDEQLKEIDDLIVKSGANVEAFCEWIGVKEVGTVPQTKFAEAINMLKAKLAKKEAANVGDAKQNN